MSKKIEKINPINIKKDIQKKIKQIEVFKVNLDTAYKDLLSLKESLEDIELGNSLIKIICPRCDGTKYNLSSVGMSSNNKKCILCKGKGYIRAKKYIT